MYICMYGNLEIYIYTYIDIEMYRYVSKLQPEPAQGGDTDMHGRGGARPRLPGRRLGRTGYSL